MTTQTPSQIGRYRIERELGRGTMGVVYEAVDTTLGRTVALKTFGAMAAIAPHEREAFEQRFLSEARISATLDDPHVVAVYDVGRDFETGLLFMALEFVRGETLANTLSRGPMPWNEAAQIVAKVARALQTAHTHHIVHRDIKPANIMLTTLREPKIMDFGIAKASAAQLTMAGQVFGTPAYMSPEQATGEQVDGRSDIFSLGAVLHELVTNTRAFEGPTMPVTLTNILRIEPRPASSFGRAIPRALDAVIARALRKSRDARYDTAAQFATDLEKLIDGQSPIHATQLSPLETIELNKSQIPASYSSSSRPSAATPTPPVVLDLTMERPPKASMRLATAIAAGVALGIAVVLLAQRGWTVDKAPTDSVANAAIPSAQAPLATPPAAIPNTPVAAPTEAASAAPLSMVASGPPVKIELELRHPFASASLRIKLDDRIALATSVSGMPIRNAGVTTGFDGRFGAELKIAPGDHSIGVELRSGATEVSGTSRIRVRGNDSRKLMAAVQDGQITLTFQ